MTSLFLIQQGPAKDEFILRATHRLTLNGWHTDSSRCQCIYKLVLRILSYKSKPYYI